MQAVNSILVPVDFSASSKHALAHAIQLADTFGASLHVVHVLDDSFALAGYLELYAGDYMETAVRQAAAELEGLLTPEQKARDSATLVVRTGKPATEILGYLGEHREVDLVVMATAGRGRVARFMMGSVTDRVLRTAPCPVLTVHAHDHVEEGNRSARPPRNVPHIVRNTPRTHTPLLRPSDIVDSTAAATSTSARSSTRA
jgi:nucleotide-binding universal stress UspA family protein